MSGELSVFLLGQYQKDLDVVRRQLFELGGAAFDLQRALGRPEADKALRAACLVELERALERLPKEFMKAYTNE